jgi:hypothetical protein
VRTNIFVDKIQEDGSSYKLPNAKGKKLTCIFIKIQIINERGHMGV